MTSEIAVMNKEAVALAADSAASWGNNKVFSSNKVFSLSKYAPIGIMVYGTAQFMEIPWEIIIKQYRNHLNNKIFDTVCDYANDFIKFIKESDMFSIDQERRYIYFSCNNYILSHLKPAIEQLIITLIVSERNGKPYEKLPDVLSKFLNNELELWEKENFLIKNPDKLHLYLQSDYDIGVEQLINSKSLNNMHFIDEKNKDLVFSPEIKAKIKKLLINYVLKKREDLNKISQSGIVITGFGNKEIFPYLVSYSFYGRISDKLIFDKDQTIKVDFEHTSKILTFAQEDVIKTFLEGIHPGYEKNIQIYFSEISSEIFKLLTDIFKNKISKRDQDKINQVETRIQELNKKIGRASFRERE